jgi:hypothetical protein
MKSRQPKLRTKPLEHSHVRLPDKGWRALGEGRRVAPLAAPGGYHVRLRVGDQQLTQPLEVLKDPASAGSEREVIEQVALLLEIRGHVDEVVSMIDEIEWIRKQIDDLEAMLEEREAVAELLAAAGAFDQKLIDLEGDFFDLRLTGGTARQDTLRWPRRLYAKLTSLAGYIGRSDFPPTSQQLQVLEIYRGRLAEARKGLAELRSGDLAALNTQLAAEGFGKLVSGLWWQEPSPR